MHVREVELVLAFLLQYLLVLRAVIIGEAALLSPSAVFFRRHHDRCHHVGVADFVADDVAVERIVVLHGLPHILRTDEIGGVLFEVVVGYRGSALHLPAGMKQRVGNLLLVNLHLGRLRLLDGVRRCNGTDQLCERYKVEGRMSPAQQTDAAEKQDDEERYVLLSFQEDGGLGAFLIPFRRRGMCGR